MQDPLGIYKTTNVEQAPNPIQGDLSGIASVMNMLSILQGKPITLDFKTPQEDAFTKKQDPKGLYKTQSDRAFSSKEDPKEVYSGVLRPGEGDTRTHSITFTGGK